jgi:hypothetical protein
MDPFQFPDEIEDEVVKATDKDDVEIEIEIVDDTPAQDRGRKPLDREVEDPSDDEIENYSDKVKSRIKELTHARHDERRAKESVLRERVELERLAQTLIDENKNLKQYVNHGTQHYATTIKSAAEAELAMARKQFKEAQEAFDTDAIMAAQEALSDAKWRLEEAKRFNPAPLQIDNGVVQQRQSTPEPVEPDQKTQRWMQKNQWFGSPGYEELTSYSLGLHQKLVNSGVDPSSDEYFGHINARLHSKFPEVFGGSKDKGSGRSTTVVASATRSSGAKRVQLTTTQLALAKKFNLTPQQYAAQVAKLENSNG